MKISFLGGRRSILAESEESSQNKILRLEKETRRLQSIVNSYNASMTSNQISDAKMIELEKENKRLSNKVKQLQEKVQKVSFSWNYTQLLIIINIEI